MFSIHHFLWILPVIVQAQITINIQATEPRKASVKATGVLETILTEDHKELFHITDSLLKNAIFDLTGQYGDVYLKEPSFGGNVYDNYKLEPVRSVLKPNGTLIKVKTKEEFLNHIQVFNNDAFEKSQNVAMTGLVEDNFTCDWKQNNVFPADIIYNIDVNSLGEDPSWNIKTKFGRNIRKTKSIPTTASFTVDLGPKSDVIATVSATKVSLLIEVLYTVTLAGHVLTKFENTYLWGYENYDIKTVMTSASMPNMVMVSEEITVEYYTNCIVKLFGHDLSPINTRYGENQCTFITVDVGKNESLSSLISAQQKISRDGVKDVKQSQGNNAVTTSESLVLVFFICIFMKIHMF